MLQVAIDNFTAFQLRSGGEGRRKERGRERERERDEKWPVLQQCSIIFLAFRTCPCVEVVWEGGGEGAGWVVRGDPSPIPSRSPHCPLRLTAGARPRQSHSASNSTPSP